MTFTFLQSGAGGVPVAVPGHDHEPALGAAPPFGPMAFTFLQSGAGPTSGDIGHDHMAPTIVQLGAGFLVFPRSTGHNQPVPAGVHSGAGG
jgi:hypothetical protein